MTIAQMIYFDPIGLSGQHVCWFTQWTCIHAHVHCSLSLSLSHTHTRTHARARAPANSNTTSQCRKMTKKEIVPVHINSTSTTNIKQQRHPF